jgi:hypothetical protein
MPAARVTGMSWDAGLSAAATLKLAATSLPPSVPSLVCCTAEISVRPSWLPALKNPGVTHLPVASITVAPAGTGTFAPTATMAPSLITTVPASIFGPDTG